MTRKRKHFVGGTLPVDGSKAEVCAHLRLARSLVSNAANFPNGEVANSPERLALGLESGNFLASITRKCDAHCSSKHRRELGPQVKAWIDRVIVPGLVAELMGGAAVEFCEDTDIVVECKPMDRQSGEEDQ